jgi:hypothetical protein
MAKQGKQPKQAKSVPDFRLMYQLAERYSEASELLSEQAKGKVYGCSAPMLLVDSFAVELYLKCLDVLDNNRAPLGDHPWTLLFDRLASHTKIMIREAFVGIVQNDPVLRHLRVINPAAPPVTDFDTSLKAGSRTFAGRRYLYEEGDRSNWFYAHLIRTAIRKVTKMDLRLASLSKSEGSPSGT